MIETIKKISVSRYSFFFAILSSFFMPIAPNIAIPWPLLVTVQTNQDLRIETAVYIFYITGCALSTIGIILAVRGAKINKYRAFAITGFIMNVYFLANCVGYLVILLTPIGMI
ncbi:MAG: hypothetical protein ACFFCS_23535 [Candidatus Hodarchaeota archaeon]